MTNPSARTLVLDNLQIYADKNKLIKAAVPVRVQTINNCNISVFPLGRLDRLLALPNFTATTAFTDLKINEEVSVVLPREELPDRYRGSYGWTIQCCIRTERISAIDPPGYDKVGICFSSGIKS